MNWKGFFLSCLLILSLTFVVFAEKKFRVVHQKADQLEYDDKTKIMHLEGHVVIWQGKMILTCSHATYYLRTQEATAYGDLKMKSPHGYITGEKLHVYYPKKTLFVYGHVVLVYYPKKKKGTVSSPIIMTSDELKYKWGKKVATAEGSVVLTQNGRKASGDRAVFDKRLETLIMDGHVSLFRPPQNHLVCDHLVYHLKTDSAVAKGHVQAVFLVKRENHLVLKKPSSSGAADSKTPFLDDRAWFFT